jgi:uncharacterized protein
MRMRLTLDGTAGHNVIRAYAPGVIRINDSNVPGAVIVSATDITPQPLLATVGELTLELARRVLTAQPDLVLLGTGVRHLFPAPDFGAAFLSAGVGFEVMDTGAACRTFNVLIAEQRRVVAILLSL